LNRIKVLFEECYGSFMFSKCPRICDDTVGGRN